MTIPHRVRDEYAAGAARYDRRWAAYLRGSMELVRPWLAEAPPGALLDVGCGTGVLLDALGRWGVTPERYTGADPSLEMLRMAAAKGVAGLACAPAEALPFRDGVFGTVVSMSAFHYWPAPREGLREMARVLAPGGRVLVADWARDFATMRVMDAATRITGHAFVRTYAEAEACALVEEAGLRVVRSRRAKIGRMWGLWVVEARGG
jgi:ubiquinone/menaquinone biosynthesis C-methylase UbiE